LHLMLEDWTTDYSFDTPNMRQKTSRNWSEFMHHFARVIMLDLYSLPAEHIM
jgi:hypothetical protein